MSYYPHGFEAEIVHHDLGTYRYTVVFLPPDLAAALPFRDEPRLRASGEIGEVPFAGAWQPSKGRWYLMLSKKLLRDGGLAVGDRVEVRFRLEPQDEVDAPAILLRALKADAAATMIWEALTPGKRRALAHRIGSAKTAATTERRVAEMLAALHGEPVPSLARLNLRG